MKVIRNKELEIKTHKRSVVYDIYIPPHQKKSKAVIFLHGFKGYKNWGYFPLACKQIAQQLNIPLIALNFSHNGTDAQHPSEFVDLEAFGLNTFSHELDDVQHIIEHISCGKEAILGSISSFAIIGHSRGGSTAMLSAMKFSEVKTCVTWAAVVNIVNRYGKKDRSEFLEKGVKYITNGRTGQEMPIYRTLSDDILKNEVDYDLTKILIDLDKPILCLHGSGDEAVSVEEMRLLPEHFKKKIIEGANHTFGGKEPWEDKNIPTDALILVNETVQFLKELFIQKDML